MTSDSRTAIGLAEIRRRRTQVWIALAGYLPVCATILFALRSLGIDMEGRGGYVALPYMALFGWLGLRVGFVRCPGCGDHFHGRWPRSNPWIGACRYCGLRLRD